ncbi:outer membrane beta-barrel protein [uncultured Draconibacterium sp.]|uniref:outer membrane beta-barrel protein n=1 Tax=uncultured Draconibacterium sp. TaxID=1573823 RepID=UPI003217C936
MKTLLKSLLAFVLFFVVAQSQAQISVGGGLWYGSDISSIGISVNGKYAFNEKWSAAPAFTYFLEKDYVKWSALDFDANYAITDIENVGSLYGIGGLSVTFWKVDFGDTFGMGDYGIDLDASGSDVGVNLGLGLNVMASEKLAIAPEIKYTISDGGYLRIGAKILFGL